MPDDATESVAKHRSRLQSSINLPAQVTTYMISCSGTFIYPDNYLIVIFFLL